MNVLKIYKSLCLKCPGFNYTLPYFQALLHRRRNFIRVSCTSETKKMLALKWVSRCRRKKIFFPEVFFPLNFLQISRHKVTKLFPLIRLDDRQRTVFCLSNQHFFLPKLKKSVEKVNELRLIQKNDSNQQKSTCLVDAIFQNFFLHLLSIPAWKLWFVVVVNGFEHARRTR